MLRLDGRWRPDILMHRFSMSVTPIAHLEIQGAFSWIVLSNGFVMVRLPVDTVKDSNVDVAGPLGAPAFNALRSVLGFRQRETFLQCDADRIEVYGEDRRPFASVVRGTHRMESMERLRAMQRPAWEYPVVVGVRPKQLVAAAAAMGDPNLLYLHMDPKDGRVSTPVRVSTSLYGDDNRPHGYVQPLSIDPKAAQAALERHVDTAAVARRVAETHPWFDRVEPVQPVK